MTDYIDLELTSDSQIELSVVSEGLYELDVSESVCHASLQTKNVSYTPTESAQSATVQADSNYDGLEKVNVSVGAISSTYVGSGVPRRTSSDLSASGATVTVPSGYYESSASESVASGSVGTPVASKGSVNNHIMNITPSVSSSAGYISGGSKTGTVVQVAASELVSGTKSITSNGTGIDVTNYAAVDVSVQSSTPATVVTTETLPNGADHVIITGVDISDTTATASDVASGKYFYTAAGVKTAGTASGVVTKTITNIISSSVTLVTGYLNSGGTSITAQGSSTKEVTTDFIDVHGFANTNVVMWQKIANRIGPWVGVVFYDSSYERNTSRQIMCEPFSANNSFQNNGSSLEFVGSTGIAFASGATFTIPSTAYYARISFRTGGNTQICLTTDTTSLGYWSGDIDEIVFSNALSSDGTAT